MSFNTQKAAEAPFADRQKAEFKAQEQIWTKVMDGIDALRDMKRSDRPQNERNVQIRIVNGLLSKLQERSERWAREQKRLKAVDAQSNE